MTPRWFAEWVEEADTRRARRERVAYLLSVIGSVLLIAGVLLVIVATMWIDATDVCRDNVVMALVGLLLAGCGGGMKYYEL